MTTKSTTEKPDLPLQAHLGMERFRPRLMQDHVERAMSAAWVKLMQSKGQNHHAMLDAILGESATERDALVASTTIVWLASRPGMEWLAQTLGEMGVELPQAAGAVKVDVEPELY